MRERLREDLKYLDGIIPFLCALGCLRAWLTLTAVTPVFLAPLAFDYHVLFDISYSLLALVVALAAKKIIPLCVSKRWYLVSLVLMLVSSACCVVAMFNWDVASILGVVSAISGGVGASLFLLIWAEVLSRVSLFKIFLYTTASQVFGAVCVFFCKGFDELRCAVAVLLLPFVAVACLTYAFCKIPKEARPKMTSTKFTYPWKLFALLALFSFVYGMRQQQLVEGSGVHSSLSTALIMTILFFAALLLREKLNVSLLYRSPIMLMICGLLLIPTEGVLGTTLSSYLVSISYSLIVLLVSLLLYDISKRLGIAIVLLASVKAVLQIFVVLGDGFSQILDSPVIPVATNDAIVTGLSAGLILIGSVLLYSERELASKWGVQILEKGTFAEQSSREEFLEARCTELACRYRLSPREEEILHLLAEGKTGPEIEKALYIAEGTFKAHTRHIYEKMGINSRKQLKEMVEEQTCSPSTP